MKATQVQCRPGAEAIPVNVHLRVVGGKMPPAQPSPAMMEVIDAGGHRGVLVRDWGTVANAQGCRLCPAARCTLRPNGVCHTLVTLPMTDAEAWAHRSQ